MAVEKRRVLAINSLEVGYGSTYRMRSLVRELKFRTEDFDVTYVELVGRPLNRLVKLLMKACSNYDVLWVQKFNPITLPVMILARLRGKPILADWDDLDAGLQASRTMRFLTRVSEWVGPYIASVITTHSQVIAKRVPRQRPCYLVSQGFDPLIFYPRSEVERMQSRSYIGCESDYFIIGHVCTLTHGGMMGLEPLLGMLSQTVSPWVRFIIAGGGKHESYVWNLIDELNVRDRVIVTGLLSQEHLAQVMSTFDVSAVYMPRSTANEARVSLKVVESLAMGLPVVGQVVGETKRLFGRFIIQADLNLLQDMLRSRSVPQVNRISVADYSWSVIGKALHQAFNDLP